MKLVTFIIRVLAAYLLLLILLLPLSVFCLLAPVYLVDQMGWKLIKVVDMIAPIE